MDPVDLCVCPKCESRLLQLAHSEAIDGRRWFLRRHCPECGWWGDGEYGRKECLAFDKTLAKGFDSLARCAKALERESMWGFVEVFSTALRANAIRPEDFQ